MPCQALAVDRAGRPDPESVDQTGRPTCTRSCMLTCYLGRSIERSTDCKYPTLKWGRSTGRSTVRLGTVDRAVDQPESNCSPVLARSIGRSTGRLNGHFFDCWPVDRKANLGLVSSQRANFYGAYLNPICELFWLRFSRRKISYSFSVFHQKVLGSKFLFSICFKVFDISKKIVFWEFVFWSKNSISIWRFSQVIFFVQNTLFSHT